VRTVVVSGLLVGEFGDDLVERDAVVHEHVDALDGDRRGVARDACPRPSTSTFTYVCPTV
jgi:hypothetical protein